MVLRHPSEKTLYIAADTVWYSEVEQTLKKFKPEVIVVNGGDNRFFIGNQLVMNKEDIFNVYISASHSTLIVVHMEGVNHNTLSKSELREFISEKGITQKVLVPNDGEKINL